MIEHNGAVKQQSLDLADKRLHQAIDFCPDPGSNTGSDSRGQAWRGLEVGIDGLSLLWTDTLPILDFARELLDCRFDWSSSHERRIGVLWNRCYTGTLGCLYSQRDTQEGVHHRLSLSGQILARVPAGIVHRFLQLCYQYDTVRCSRIDLRADDFERQLDVNQIRAALQDGNYGGFVNSSIVTNYGKDGWTCYLGSRQSEQYVRIYDKFAESKGKLDCIRWESEYKGHKAEYICRQIALLDSCEARDMARWVVGSVSFVDKRDKNISRCDRLDWWAAFAMRVTQDALLARVERVASTLSRRRVWLQKQVSKTLALLDKAIGADQFEAMLAELISIGRDKLRCRDNILIHEYLSCE